MYCHIIAFIDRHSDFLLLSGSKDFSLIIKKMGLRQLALQCHLGKCKFTSYFCSACIGGVCDSEQRLTCQGIMVFNATFNNISVISWD